MLVAALVGCQDPGKPGGADPVDSGGDTGAAGWEPEGECTLSNPLHVDPTEERERAALDGPGLVDLVAFSTDVETAADWYGCPTVTETGTETTIRGDCDLDGWTHTGTWTLTDDGIRLEDVAFTGWNVSDEVFRGDGTSSILDLGDGTRSYAVDVSVFLQDAGISWPFIDGSWDEHLSALLTGDDTQTWSGWFDYAPLGGDAADYCYQGSTSSSATCDAEPSGAWALIGDHTLIVRYDPEVACDGCGNGTLDGVDVGLVCW